MLFTSKILQKERSDLLNTGGPVCSLCPENTQQRAEWRSKNPKTFMVFSPDAFMEDLSFFEPIWKDIGWRFPQDVVAFSFPLCSFPHTPRVANLRACEEVFQDILEAFCPNLVVVVGKEAAKYLLGHGVSPPDIRTLAGQFILPDEFAVKGYLTPFIVIRSPSFILSFEDEVAAGELFSDHLRKVEALWRELQTRPRQKAR